MIKAKLKMYLAALVLLSGGAFHPAAAQFDKWTQVTPLPTPRTGLSVVSLQGDIYAIGGRDADKRALDVVERYDSQRQRWETVAPLRQPRYNAAAVVWRDGIVVLGGRGPEEEDDENDDRDVEVLADAEIYHPDTDQWTSFPALNEEREYAAAVRLRGTIYVFGGVDDGEELLTSIERYDFQEQEWEETEATLPRPRAAMAAASMGNAALLIGGFEGAEPFFPTASILRFEVRTGVTELETALPTPRGGLVAAAVRDSIFVLGGRSRSNILRTVNMLSRTGNTIGVQRTSSLATGRLDAGAAALGDSVYVVGGTNEGGEVMASVESRSATGTDRHSPALPSDFELHPNRPNPFRGQTRISFRTSQAASGEPTLLRVYDALGRRAATLVQSVLSPGRHHVVWNGTSSSGKPLPAGVYFLRLQQGDLLTWRTMTIIR